MNTLDDDARASPADAGDPDLATLERRMRAYIARLRGQPREPDLQHVFGPRRATASTPRN